MKKSLVILFICSLAISSRTFCREKPSISESKENLGSAPKNKKMLLAKGLLGLSACAFFAYRAYCGINNKRTWVHIPENYTILPAYIFVTVGLDWATDKIISKDIFSVDAHSRKAYDILANIASAGLSGASLAYSVTKFKELIKKA